MHTHFPILENELAATYHTGNKHLLNTISDLAQGHQ